MSVYGDEMRRLIDEAVDGMEAYCSDLEDLDGKVLSRIDEMSALTEGEAFGDPHVGEQILVLLEEARLGAMRYAEELFDSTACTSPLGDVEGLLG